MDIQQNTPVRSGVGTLSIKDVWPELRTFSRRDSGSILKLAFAQTDLFVFFAVRSFQQTV
jgi:hypothetical protein